MLQNHKSYVAQWKFQFDKINFEVFFKTKTRQPGKYFRRRSKNKRQFQHTIMRRSVYY